MSDFKNVNPHVSVDCVVFGFDSERLQVLLIEKRSKDGKRQFGIPGDLILEDEGLHDAANRILLELTSLKGIFLKQFHTFGNPNRVKETKDLAWLQSYREQPSARVITVGYYALIQMNDFEPDASSFAFKVFWCDVNDIPPLSFDHNKIINAALDRLRTDFEVKKAGFELLPEKFTLGHIQNLYEMILGKQLDKRNFRKKLLKEKLVIPTNEKQTGVLHKPAQLFTLSPNQPET